jgi:hypothetical protein
MDAAPAFGHDYQQPMLSSLQITSAPEHSSSPLAERFIGRGQKKPGHPDHPVRPSAIPRHLSPAALDSFSGRVAGVATSLTQICLIRLSLHRSAPWQRRFFHEAAMLVT